MTEPKRLTPEELAYIIKWLRSDGLVTTADSISGHIAALEAELAAKDAEIAQATLSPEERAQVLIRNLPMGGGSL